jgi:DNA polymerase-3 subunit alpha
MISDGDTDGVFQLEGDGMRQFLTGMKPSQLEDIIAAVSLYRPGPMDSIPRYVAGKQNPKNVRYAHEKLKPILDVTYGCMVYQEQVMQIVRDLAGYSIARSDLVRRAMSKKKHDVMAKEKEYFIHGRIVDGVIDVPGAIRLGIPEKVAIRLFDEMTAFASYAYNKSHAAAYGMIAVQTAWLKRYHPVEFLTATMNSATGNTEKIALYIQHLRKLGISVLPPDVNASGERFSVDRTGESPALRFGMSAVKNVGHSAISAIVSEVKQSGKYIDLTDFLSRVGFDNVNKRAVESLIRAGAMDSLPGHRAQKLAMFESAMDGITKSRKHAVEGQISLFGGFDDSESVELPPQPLPKVDELPLKALLSMEKEMIGVYITGHPLDEFRAELSEFEVNSRWLNSLEEERDDHGQMYDGLNVQMAGILTDLRTKVTKNGSMMAFAILEDLYGTVEALVFPRVFEQLSGALKLDSPVVFSGKISIREEEAPKLLLADVKPLIHASQSSAPLDAEVPAAPVKERREERKLYLKVKDEAQRDIVMPILRRTPGNISVTFYIEESGKAFAAPRDLWVSDKYELNTLSDALGERRIVLK